MRTYLPLGGEVAVAGGNAKQEAVVLGEDVGVLKDGDVGGLGGSVHLVEDLLGESLGNLVDVDLSAGGLGTLLLGLGELPDVAVHGVLDMDSRQQWVHEGHRVAVKRHWE